jgi:hypothetical protein
VEVSDASVLGLQLRGMAVVGSQKCLACQFFLCRLEDYASRTEPRFAQQGYGHQWQLRPLVYELGAILEERRDRIVLP